MKRAHCVTLATFGIILVGSALLALGAPAILAPSVSEVAGPTSPIVSGDPGREARGVSVEDRRTVSNASASASASAFAGSTALIASAVTAVQTPPPTQRPTAPVAAANCTTSGCHGEVRDHRQLHGPVGVGACDACHTAVDEQAHTFRLARTGAALCNFCHEVDVEGAAVVHEPLETGDCTACHSPHGGTNRSLLKAASPSEMCSQCHEDVLGNKTHVHGPVAAGACSACHSPHASNYPNLLFAEGPALCVQCHVTTKTQIESMRYVHGPAAVDCQLCHDGHASDHPMMLKEEAGTLCMSCHESIKHTVETAKTQHAAVTTDRECLNCHSPHGSDFPAVLSEDMLTLCFECHDREIELPDGGKLGNIKQVIQAGTSVHGPIAQNNCAACHQIHGGDNFRLLTKEYPPEFYAPFKEESYALCFSCHDPQVVRDPQTTALTDFRNGDTNLHYLHVNKDRKGRTCRACHETHASREPKHIRDAVPFGSGGWKLPINFAKTSTGGSCGPGCHRPYAYDRIEPVDYDPDAPAAIWPGADGAASGPAPENRGDRP